MGTVTAKELKDHPADVLGRVQYGNERVAVTRYGKEVAAVVPIADLDFLEELEDVSRVSSNFDIDASQLAEAEA